MKKVIFSCLIAALLLTVTACGPTGQGGNESDSGNESSSQSGTESSGVTDTVDPDAYPTFEYELKLDGTAEIVKYKGVDGVTELTIPSTLDGHSVSAIGTLAFEECRELTKVVIPEGVKSIGVQAFRLCTSLKEVVIPESCLDIDRGVFYYCSELTNVTLPSKLTAIPDYTFYMCTSLKEISVPTTVTEIGVSAFNHCQISNFPLHEGIVRIGGYAFEGNLITEIKLPSTCKEVGGWAFYNCVNVTTITLNDGLETVGGGAFYNLDKVTSVIFPDSVTAIGSYALRGCKSLTELYVPFVGEKASASTSDINNFMHLFGDDAGEGGSLPEGLKSVTIGSNFTVLVKDSFSGIEGLEEITFTKFKYIRDGVFANCTNLKKITLPAGVSKIGKKAFDGCTSLKDIVFGGTVEAWNSIENKATMPSGLTITCTDGTIVID